jgi:hypothetical protein
MNCKKSHLLKFPLFDSIINNLMLPENGNFLFIRFAAPWTVPLGRGMTPLDPPPNRHSPSGSKMKKLTISIFREQQNFNY